MNENIEQNKFDGVKGSEIKEKMVKNAIRSALEEFGIQDEQRVEAILKLAINQNEY